MFRPENSLGICLDQGAVKVYIQIRDQFMYMSRSENRSSICLHRSENSSGICFVQRTVQVYVQIREQFRYMFRLENSSGICSDQITV